MSIQAAQRMGLRCVSLDPAEDSPASQIAAARAGSLSDPRAIAEIFELADHITLENEFIPADAIPEDPRLVPGRVALANIQDKLRQRQCLERAGVPSARAVPIPADGGPLDLPFPMVLKARFGGYDGKGTRYARNAEEFEAHRDLWSKGNWMAEEFVPFRRELAVMVYRGPFGEGAFPTMETVQVNHVCDLVYPAGVNAREVALAAVRAIEGFGLFGVELFELPDGQTVINEIAPRPHNTGHYTLDMGGVSQFEQHVRLAMGYAPSEPVVQPVCMANLLGQPGAGDYRRGLEAALRHPGVHVHWYGKSEAKAGRKMGHLNAVGEDCVERAKAARDAFYQAWVS